MTETTGLYPAMLAVQAEAETLPKDRTVTVKTKTGGEYSYSYTPLDTIVETVGPLLTKNGLVWSTQPTNAPSGSPSLKYTLTHAQTGESITGEMLLVIEGDRAEDVQALGSAITYARRYALSAVLNLVADADDDGRGAGGGQGAQDKTCPKCGAAAIIKGKEEYGGGWVCFKKKGGCGAKFTTDPSESPEESLASASQKQRLRSEITRNKLNATVMDALFKGVGFAREDGEKANDALNRLTSAQCSSLIDEISKGAIKTGESDVPGAADGEFVVPAGGAMELGGEA